MGVEAKQSFYAVFLAVILASCGQDAPPAPSEPAATQQMASPNVIANAAPERWTMRNATLANGAFVLQPGGAVSASNPQFPVRAGETWAASATINAQTAGRLVLHVTGGCGAMETPERSFMRVDVTVGQNVLTGRHQFTSDAGCARLAIAAPNSPMTFTLTEALLARTQ